MGRSLQGRRSPPIDQAGRIVRDAPRKRSVTEIQGYRASRRDGSHIAQLAAIEEREGGGCERRARTGFSSMALMPRRE